MTQLGVPSKASQLFAARAALHKKKSTNELSQTHGPFTNRRISEPLYSLLNKESLTMGKARTMDHTESMQIVSSDKKTNESTSNKSMTKTEVGSTSKARRSLKHRKSDQFPRSTEGETLPITNKAKSGSGVSKPEGKLAKPGLRKTVAQPGVVKRRKPRKSDPFPRGLKSKKLPDVVEVKKTIPIPIAKETRDMVTQVDFVCGENRRLRRELADAEKTYETVLKACSLESKGVIDQLKARLAESESESKRIKTQRGQFGMVAGLVVLALLMEIFRRMLVANVPMEPLC